MSTRIGVYPGTFDPVTLGHMDIIRRGAKLVDKLVIGVTTNPSKNPMFAPDERSAMVQREVGAMGIENTEVVGFHALIIQIVLPGDRKDLGEILFLRFPNDHGAIITPAGGWMSTAAGSNLTPSGPPAICSRRSM